MPQDSKGLVLIYGGVKEEQKRRKMREESGQNTLEELVQKRSSSMSTNKHSLTTKKSNIKDKQHRINMAQALFGPTVKPMEISSYKKDAALLLANRIQKKFREAFTVLQDFCSF